MAKGIADLLAAARARISEILPAHAAEEMWDDPQLLVLDVREREEYCRGHIPGALLIPRGLLEPKAAADSPIRAAQFEDFARRILVYCGSGVRSALAADVLGQLGFTEVMSLKGGYDDWVKLELPVEQA